MKLSRLFVAVLLASSLLIFPAQSQLLPSQGKGAARAQVAMLKVNGAVAAGIVAGFDADKMYIATAAHVADLGSEPLANVDVRFEGAPDVPRQGVFNSKFDPPNQGDLAVVVVNLDDSLRGFLNGLDFAMLSPVPLPPVGSPVTSIGYSDGSMWTSGTNESLLPIDRGNLHFTSEVGEGQSGGAVYNDAWELIGIALRSGEGTVYARPIEAVIKSLKNWDIPVRLTARPLKGRVKGADELARENEARAQRALRRNLAQRLAAEADSIRKDSPVRSLLLAAESVNATSQDGIAIAASRGALADSLQQISGSGLSGHADSIFKATFSLDERLLATVSRDGAIRVWSLDEPTSPRCIKVMKESGRALQEGGAGNYVVSEFIAFDTRSKILISQAFGGPDQPPTSPKVWRLDSADRTPEPTWLLPDQTPTTALAVSHDSDLIAVADVRDRLLVYNLGEALDRPVKVFSIPTGHEVSHLQFSQDGTVLIAGTRDARVVIWDLNSAGNNPTATFDTEHQEQGILGKSRPDLDLLDMTKDHSLLLTGSSHWSVEGRFADPTLRIWPLRHLIPKSAPWVIDQSGTEESKVVVDGFFDESSRFVVGLTSSGTINVWDLSKARFGARRDNSSPFARLKAPDFVQSDARSWDRRLLTFSQAKSVSVTRIADITSGRPLVLRNLGGFDGSVEFVQLSNSAKFLVAGGIGGTARLWNLTSVDPAEPSSSLVPNPYTEVRGLELSATGRTAVTLRGQSLEFWNIERPSEPKLLYAADIDLKEFGDCIVCQIILSPDEHWIALQSAAKASSRIVEIGTDRQTRKEFAVAARTWRNTSEIVFSPDSRWLFVEGANGSRGVYDLQSATIERKVLSDSELYSPPTFSPDGKWVCFQRYINEFHEAIGRDKIVGFIAPTEAAADITRRVTIRGFATRIGSVEFSPDSRWVAISGDHNSLLPEQDDRTVQVMHLEDGAWTNRADLEPIEYAASGLRFSADSHWLFTGSGDITLGDRNVSARVWNLSSPITPTSGQRLPNVVWNLKSVEFSPDSKWLVTVSGAEQYARLWVLNGDKLEFVSKLFGPKPHLNNHWSAVFSTDSSSLILWTIDDANPFYWKLNNGPIAEIGSAIPNGDGEIRDVQFSAGGRVLTVLNSGATTTGTSGTEAAHFTVVDLSAFPDEDSYTIIPAPTGANSHVYREDLGLILAAGDTIVGTPTDVQSEMRRAANVAGRNLTWDEWVKSGIAMRYHPTFPDVFVGADVVAAENNSFADLSPEQRATEGDQLKRNLVLWARELDDAESCNGVAWELAKLRDLVEAIELSSCALRLEPNNPNYHDTRGLALALSGRREEAIAEFQYFIQNEQGVERFSRSIVVRQKWIESLRSGQDPFAEGFE